MPGRTWQAQYAGEEPPAYVAVIPLDTLKSHYPAPMGALSAEVNRVIAAAQGGPLRRGGVAGGLPYLPLPNAAQAASGSLARISNNDIQGFRYLTVYSQEAGIRFPRTAVRYTFQGVTRDGKHLVIMHVPYEVRTLPTAEQIEREDSRNRGFLAPFPGTPGGLSQEAFAKKNEQYLRDLTTKLDAEGRVGRLSALDSVVRSIQVR